MIGKIFITSSGYDPERGKYVKDPFLKGEPSLGACRPDIRRVVKPGDFIFTISGKVPDARQYVMCGFEVAEKIHAIQAYYRFPNQHLCKMVDGQLYGNIILNSAGKKHVLDQHTDNEAAFQRRAQNFIVGKNLIMPQTPSEIARARKETMDTLCRVIGKLGSRPFDLIGRSGKTLDEKQVIMLIEWLLSLKEIEAVA